MWTGFKDMHSGGGQKLKWEYVYIEAPKAEAMSVFHEIFGRRSDHVTCNCCGPDYSINEMYTLEQVSAFERGCAFDANDDKWVERWCGDPYRPYVTLSEWEKSGKCLVRREGTFESRDRLADVPGRMKFNQKYTVDQEYEVLVAYWLEHYVRDGQCVLCSGHGEIKLRNGDQLHCMCPNGIVQRRLDAEKKGVTT